MLLKDTLQATLKTLLDNQLGAAIRLLENDLLTRTQHPSDMERLQAIKADYELMVGYWKKGYDDPQRATLYRQLAVRLYTLVANMLTNDHLLLSPFLRNLYSRPRQSGRQWSTQALHRQLEDFVSSQALLSLEPEHTRQAKLNSLHEEHARLMNDLFDYIVTSRQWSDQLAESFTNMLLAPTIDVLDQQLIVSAITLSAISVFDYNKFLVLSRVYTLTEDDALRQRALVGWVLAVDAAMVQLYPELSLRIAELCADELTRQALTELQLQLYYCIEAEDDGRTIREEIIPDIMKGSNIRVTRQGIEEIDEDQLEDILHPEAAEQNMEAMEQSVKRMADMQQQGTDIYYGGFSQMKRFAFFNNPSAWFVPFYPLHPAVSTIWNKAKLKRFLEGITEKGAFCDSDKYSFVLAYEKVLERLPPSMFEMMERGEAELMPVGGAVSTEEQQRPAYLRRMYLQDLYRFFRLFSVRSEFSSPFAEARRYLFFACDIYRPTPLRDRMPEVASFMLKHNRPVEETIMVLDNYAAATISSATSCSYNYYMVRAHVTTGDERRQCYNEALRLRPDSEQALAGLARTDFNLQHYDEATSAYRRLTALQSDRMSYELNLAACLASTGQYDEAEQRLFKLYYMHPESMTVVRVLAWTLMAAGKLSQAEHYYLQLQADDDQHRQENITNHALCLWLSGRRNEAIAMFCTVDDRDVVLQAIRQERSFLLARGITKTDLLLMADALA